MRVAVRKWGNSAAIRLPAALMAALKLDVDAVVDIREEDGRLVIEPVRAPGWSLHELLAGITPDNLHGEIDAGVAVGQEAPL